MTDSELDRGGGLDKRFVGKVESEVRGVIGEIWFEPPGERELGSMLCSQDGVAQGSSGIFLCEELRRGRRARSKDSILRR